MQCPKCNIDISDTYEGDDYSCGIIAGWYCDACDMSFAEHEYPREQLEDDVSISPTTLRVGEQIGTPISQLSGRPGQPGFKKFCEIAFSWGYP